MLSQRRKEAASCCAPVTDESVNAQTPFRLLKYRTRGNYYGNSDVSVRCRTLAIDNVSEQTQTMRFRPMPFVRCERDLEGVGRQVGSGTVSRRWRDTVGQSEESVLLADDRPARAVREADGPPSAETTRLAAALPLARNQRARELAVARVSFWPAALLTAL